MKVKKEATKEKTSGISVRLPDSLLAQVDAIAVAEQRTRGNLLRILIQEGLKAREE